MRITDCCNCDRPASHGLDTCDVCQGELDAAFANSTVIANPPAKFTGYDADGMACYSGVVL